MWAAGTEGCRGEGEEKAHVRSAETGSTDPDAMSATMNGGIELQKRPSGPSRTVSCLFAASPVFPGSQRGMRWNGLCQLLLKS